MNRSFAPRGYHLPMTRVCWLFSMARSGTSAVCYAAAAPLKLPVADEPFGPWDRTGEPFFHPPLQRELMELFRQDGLRCTPRVVEVANRLFRQMARDHAAEAVICKIPHAHPTPDDFARAFPESRAVWLMRNPLHRLNSLYVRNWLGAIGPNHDLDRFREFAKRWLARAEAERFVYDGVRDDPDSFFPRLYESWELAHSRRHVNRAVRHVRSRYHYRSKRAARMGRTQQVVSESRSALPDEAIEAYLGDELVVEVMDLVGWSTNPDDYRARNAVAPGS